MNSQPIDRYVVRPAFWPSWLFFTLFLQVLSGLTLVACVALRFIMSQPLFGRDDALGCGVGFAGCGVGSAVVMLLTRGYAGAELTAVGIRPYRGGLGGDRVFRWDSIRQVSRHHRWPSGKFLVITPDGGATFTLPERSADLQRFRDAVERFAGPDHPLASAVAAIAEE